MGRDPAEVGAQTFFGLPKPFERRHDAPKLLSEALAFTSGGVVDEETLGEALMREAPSLLPYDVQAPLWSDGAHKRRWLALPEDAASSPYDRIRSYWDSNCSMCHGARTDIQARWDARFDTLLDARGLIAEPPITGAGNGRYLIAPSDADSSVLYQRVAVTVPGFRMPPLGRNRNDDRFVALLRAWIEFLPAPGDPSAHSKD